MKIRAADAGNLKRPENVGKNSTGHAVPKEHRGKKKCFSSVTGCLTRTPPFHLLGFSLCR